MRHPLTLTYHPAISGLCVLLGMLNLLQGQSLKAESEPDYSPPFDVAKGFKPAQTNLTNIYLQVAGSLEAYGSPVPYLLHIQAEHKRVSQKYTKLAGKAHASRFPSHITEEYLAKFVSNWNLLSPKLQLDVLASEAGRCAREAILGTRGTGTIAVEIFNQHQEQVAEQMKSSSAQTVGFEQLQARLAKELEFNKPKVDMTGYETARRDAVRYSLIFQSKLDTLFTNLDSAMPTDKAGQVKGAIRGVFLDLGYLMQSELEIGILDWSLSH